MIVAPPDYYPIVRKDGTAEDQMAGWMRAVTNALNMIDGLGSPEGVVFAEPKSFYFDTVGLNLWVKTTAETLNTGWKILS